MRQSPGFSVPRLRMSNISKSFGPATVLDRAGLEVAPGEIHGLVGLNGSGKSTLIKILSGYHAPGPQARIEVDGTVLSVPVQPDQLRDLHIGFVHQDLGLDDDSTVLDNVRLGHFRPGRILRGINHALEAEAVRATLARLGSGLHPDALVGSLSARDRSLVAIARALQNCASGTGCIVFDESTRSLSRDSLTEFYTIVRQLAADGTSIVIVSHRLDEVLAVTDRLTVLLDGQVVATATTRDETERSLTELLCGREVGDLPLHGEVPQAIGETALRVSGLRSATVREVSFTVQVGEVVGVTGRPDSGFADIPALLAGVVPAAAGTVSVAGRDRALDTMGIREAIAAGIAYVPENRAAHGLALELSQLENLTLPRVGNHRRWWLADGWQEAEYRRTAAELHITPRLPHLPAAALSGGNQQKLLLGKWLKNSPAVLVVHEPTQGVDVAARRELLRALRALARRGTGVVVATSEAQDLAAVCDRIIVVADGVVARELRAPVTAHAVLDAVYGPDLSAAAQ
jgi:ribose transport system ATP-binding protein